MSSTPPIATVESALDGLLAITNDAGVPLVRNRVPKVKDAYNAYQQMVQGDLGSRLNRWRIQMKYDGAPPYPPGALIERGLADIANVPFGWMQDAMELAMAPYYDLIDATETLFRTPMTYGDDPEQRKDWEQITEMELTRLITEDEGFEYNFGCLAHQFILHGLAAPYFLDQVDINWTVGSVADFLIPRHTRAYSGAVEVACIERFYLPHELFERIEDKASANMGWNRGETWGVIKRGSTIDPQYWNNPERMEEDIKDNDFLWQARAKEIRVVHMFVRGLGKGAISHLMFDADCQCKDYMFKKIDAFDNLSQCFTIFTYGVGQNEFYHGIRGLGSKIYELVKQMDELWNAFLDAIRMNGKLVLKPGQEADLRKLALVQFGHFIVMPPKLDLQSFAMPDLSKSMFPGLTALGGLLQQKSAQYIAPDQFSEKQRGRLKQIAARMEEVAGLSVSKMNIFYNRWKALGREQVRRIIRKEWSATDRDYDRVQEFYERCKRQGVPREAIQSIDLKAVEPVKAIGAGSKAARKAIYEELQKVSVNYDEEGQYQFNRDWTRAIAGAEAARRYIPIKQGLRPPQDKSFADVENRLMDLGTTPVFEKNQLHPVHARQHLEFIGQLIQQSEEMVQQLGMSLEEINDPRAFAKAPVAKLAYDHTEQHIKAIPEKLPDGQNNPVRAELNQTFQQTGEAVNNNLKHFLRIQKQQAQQQQAAAGQPPQLSPDAQATIAADQKAEQAIAFEEKKRQLELQHIAAKNALEIQHLERLREQKRLEREEESQANQAAFDAKTAAEVAKKAAPEIPQLAAA